MFTEDNLAAASIAQVFGSELLKVQETARTDSGSQPSILNINPKQFLVNDANYSAKRKQDERELLMRLQKEAEQKCPLPPSSPPLNTTNSSTQTEPELQTSIQNNNKTLNGLMPNKQLEELNSNLIRLTNLIENCIDLFQQAAKIEQ